MCNCIDGLDTFMAMVVRTVERYAYNVYLEHMHRIFEYRVIRCTNKYFFSFQKTSLM